jgi:hypothetical protein
MSDGKIEAALLRKGARVRHDGECMHLELVVIIEAEGFIDSDTRIQFETGCFQPLLTSRMAGIEDRHIILLSKSIDCSE